jgi:hypothetical protein
MEWPLLIGIVYCIYVLVPAVVLLPRYLISSRVPAPLNVARDMAAVWRALLRACWLLSMGRWRMI